MRHGNQWRDTFDSRYRTFYRSVVLYYDGNKRLDIEIREYIVHLVQFFSSLTFLPINGLDLDI